MTRSLGSMLAGSLAVLLGAAVARAQEPPPAAIGQPQSNPHGIPAPIQSGQPPQPGMNGSSETGGVIGSNGPEMQDKLFVRKAAEGGLAEIQMSQLASQVSTNDEVKQFAQRMIADHTTLNESMAPVAESLGLMLPTKLNAEHRAAFDRLKTLSGDAFDRDYLSAMVQDHHKDLREFRMEQQTANDPALKAAVNKGAMVIREHTQMVDKLAQARGVPVPKRGPRPVAPPTGAQ